MKKNNINGITMSAIFRSEAINRDDKIAGNSLSIKKLTFDNQTYSFLGRTFLRNHMFRDLNITKNWNMAPITKTSNKSKDGGVLQWAFPSANIVEYAEIDIFGYMSTDFAVNRKNTIGLTRAIALNQWANNVSLYTNHGMVKRSGQTLEATSLFSAEEDYNYYLYSCTLDLPRIGYERVKASFKETNLPLDWLKRFFPKINESNKSKKTTAESIDQAFPESSFEEIKNYVKRPWIKPEDWESIKQINYWFKITDNDTNTVKGFIGFNEDLNRRINFGKSNRAKAKEDEENANNETAQVQSNKKEEKAIHVDITFIISDDEYYKRIEDVIKTIETGFPIRSNGTAYMTNPLFIIAGAVTSPGPFFNNAIVFNENQKIDSQLLKKFIIKDNVQKAWIEENGLYLNEPIKLETLENNVNVDQIIDWLKNKSR